MISDMFSWRSKKSFKSEGDSIKWGLDDSGDWRGLGAKYGLTRPTLDAFNRALTNFFAVETFDSVFQK